VFDVRHPFPIGRETRAGCIFYEALWGTAKRRNDPKIVMANVIAIFAGKRENDVPSIRCENGNVTARVYSVRDAQGIAFGKLPDEEITVSPCFLGRRDIEYEPSIARKRGLCAGELSCGYLLDAASAQSGRNPAIARPEKPNQDQEERESGRVYPEPSQDSVLEKWWWRSESLIFRSGKQRHIVSRNLTDKPIALARDGLDEARIIFVVRQGSANLTHCLHQIVFGDKSIFPDRIQQLLLFDGASSVLYQEYQRLKGFRGQANSLLTSVKGMAPEVQAESAEVK
jgi:hypothetical protein